VEESEIMVFFQSVQPPIQKGIHKPKKQFCHLGMREHDKSLIAHFSIDNTEDRDHTAHVHPEGYDKMIQMHP
jgi:hypothetical protein